ncbi:hypothetical protein AB0M46_48210, partial [Dactylosporangium sp. NPDC051485]|uniref:hypothetical protein n=1 Tax=Dactylosporangium sp. NPDC051485 TaxID=3154846 RepID=UPI0034212E0A
LGTYPGQTCPGYRLGGDLARFQPAVLQRLLAGTGCSHTRHSPVFTAIEHGQTWLIDTFGDRTPVTDDGTGWSRVAHPALPWTAAPITHAGPEPVFEPHGPDGDRIRCSVCGAVEEIAYRELLWPSGARVDVTRTCSVCRSSEGPEPVLDWHRQPWPPAPEHTHTQESQR